MSGSPKKRISRRGFLQAASTATLLGSAGALPGCVTAPPVREDTFGRVIVIGAGIAGISAARSLGQAGYNVTVIEGSSRLGGRIHTDHSLGAPVEMGADRIRGTNNNPIASYADVAGVDYLPFGWTNLQGFASDGTPIDTEQLNKAKADLTKLFAVAVVKNITKRRDQRVADVIQRERDSRDLSVEQNRIMNFALASTEIAFGADFGDCSWKDIRDFDEYSGGDQFVTGGFDGVPELLARGIDIRYDQVVHEIDYSSGDGVTVHTGFNRYRADFVVVTVSLGVLKNGNITFTPELPEEKLAAISDLGMGNVNKIALRFPERFWSLDPHTIVHATDTRGEYPAFLNIAKYTGEPVLQCVVPNSYRSALEGASRFTMATEAREVLEGMYGTRIPAPDRVVRSQWMSDALFRGAISYNRFGGDVNQRNDLAEPVQDRLFFAGEATHRKRYGTVVGAFLTGERVSEEIVDATRRIVT